MPDAKPKPSKGGLGKKIGPLPAWAWGVLVLAVVAFFFLRSRGATAAGGGGSSSPLASGGGPDGGGASGDNSQTPTTPNVVPVGTGSDPASGGQTSPVGSGDTGTATATATATNTSTPTSSFGETPISYLAPYAPVQNVAAAPGSDQAVTVSSHPGTDVSTTSYLGGAGGNYYRSAPVLNIPAGSNVHRPGVQL